MKCIPILMAFAAFGVVPVAIAAPFAHEEGPLTLDFGPLIIGSTVDLHVSGAQSYEQVVWYRSIAGEGHGPCPGPLGGQCLGILAPVMHAVGWTDVAGEAPLELTVPSSLGRTMCFQAFVQRGPGNANTELSNPVCKLVDLDDDADGVPDHDDACPGGDDGLDTDADGVADFCDPCPLDAPDDTDADGVCDADDICDGGDDTVDADGDGVPDDCSGALEEPLLLSPCGNSGRAGPDQADCDTAYGPDHTISVVEGYQYWTVPVSDTYTIEVAGAAGGSQVIYGDGGAGARLIGDFDLVAGDVLEILVGQVGKSGSLYDVGGGGGTFVALADGDVPLIVAGGGGGRGNCDGSDDEIIQGLAIDGDGYGGYSNGEHSYCGCGGEGSAGGGFYSDGDFGGQAFVNGGLGVDTLRLGQCIPAPGWGGFGGGGNGGNGGGGGGGYEGGNGGGPDTQTNGEGGKSYNIGGNAVRDDGFNAGDGYVIIDVAP